MVELGVITRDGLERAIVDQVIALQTALNDSNCRLEERVAERTAELEQTIARIKEANQPPLPVIASIS